MAVQANRKAFETAQKTGGGCYDIGSTALTLEVERSSSQCYGVFHDTYAQDTLSQISCYKTRNGPKPKNFLVNFDPHTGYYTEYIPTDTNFPNYEGGCNPTPTFDL